MDMFLFIIGVLGFLIGLIFLVINIVKKKSKKKALMSMGICFVLVFVGLFMPNGSSDGEESVNDTVANIEKENEKNNKKEIETSDIAITTEEKEVLKRDYEDLEDTDSMVIEIVRLKLNQGADLEEEYVNDLKRLEKAKKNEIDEILKDVEITREDEIKSIIRNRVNDGDYEDSILNTITINENLGTDIENDYIALVYFRFDRKNPKKTGNNIMRMYSDDLAATLANKNVEDVAEIAIFWEDEYNNRSLKYAYGYKNGNFHITDIAGE